MYKQKIASEKNEKSDMRYMCTPVKIVTYFIEESHLETCGTTTKWASILKLDHR
jgi:hypothetical protein